MLMLCYFKKKDNMLPSSKQFIYFSIYIFFIILSLIPKSSYSQPCYAIAIESSNNNNSSYFVEYDTELGYTKYIAKIDGNIRGLAIDSESGNIYTVQRNEFGTINPVNGAFTKISDLGSMFGKLFESDILREVVPDSIRCMTFDPFNKVVYAVDYNYSSGGSAPGSEDYLFKIDPTTGKIIRDAMLIGITRVDFVGIETVESTTSQNGEGPQPLRDVWDISINPYTEEFCCYHRSGDYAYLTILDPETGKRESDIGDVSFKDYLGVSYSRDGSALYFTSGGGFGFNDLQEDPTILWERKIYQDQMEDRMIAGIIDAGDYFFKTIDCSISSYLTYTPCQTQIDVTNSLMANVAYKAAEIINSNLFVNQDTEFYAGSEINILPGFEVKANSNQEVPNFTAAIVSCN